MIRFLSSVFACVAVVTLSSASFTRADAVVVAKHENLEHVRNNTTGVTLSPFFTAHTDGTAIGPANGWAPISPVQAATPGAASTTPKKSFSFVGDSTAAGNWTDGNGVPAGITLAFDAQFTIAAITTTEPALVLTVPGLSGTNQSGRGIGVTTQQDVNGVDDINAGRGLEFSPVTVSNVSFTGTLADTNFSFTPGGVSNFGVQLFASGVFNETNQGMVLTQGADTIGFGVTTGTIASNLRQDLNFGIYQNPLPTPPYSSEFPRQSGPFTLVTTVSAGAVRGFTLGYDVAYDISPASAAEDADFDGDGDVDGADFLTWQRGVGVGTDLSTGDANDDNVVDGDDLDIWKGQFGSAAVAAAPVPEPATALMALAAMIGAAAIRHGRRRG